jgi:hypothetical protein
MDLLFQDLVVTAVAIGAAAVLIARVRGVIVSSRKAKSCGSCPGCEVPGTAVNSQART